MALRTTERSTATGEALKASEEAKKRKTQVALKTFILLKQRQDGGILRNGFNQNYDDRAHRVTGFSSERSASSYYRWMDGMVVAIALPQL